MTQKQLALLAGMAQPRISKMERPGEESFNIETLIRLAAAFKLGLKVEFVPFSEMLTWENNYSQDAFDPDPIERDRAFLNPVANSVGRTFTIPWNTAASVQWPSVLVERHKFGNVTGVISTVGGSGVRVPQPDLTFVANPTPTSPSAEIQVTPLPSYDLISIPSAGSGVN